MKASMIIPTYNRRQQLQRVLDAVARQEYDLDAVEVLVISDE
jgi:glycosyltransferase involved in cell wall biosynthesis